MNMRKVWSESQVERAINVSFEDMFNVGYEIEKIFCRAANDSNDEMYQEDARIALEMAARFVTNDSRDKEEMQRFGRVLARLKDEATRNYDTVSCLALARIRRLMIGE